MEFTGIGTYLTAICVAVLSGVAMSGIPGGASSAKCSSSASTASPPKPSPIIAMIGFLVDPPATMINSSGDTIAGMLVTRIVEGKLDGKTPGSTGPHIPITRSLPFGKKCSGHFFLAKAWPRGLLSRCKTGYNKYVWQGETCRFFEKGELHGRRTMWQ